MVVDLTRTALRRFRTEPSGGGTCFLLPYSSVAQPAPHIPPDPGLGLAPLRRRRYWTLRGRYPGRVRRPEVRPSVLSGSPGGGAEADRLPGRRHPRDGMDLAAS